MVRQSIDVEGFGHGGLPIPAASRVGPMIMTGGVHGLDLDNGDHGDAARQIGRMFDNLARILAAGGATFAAVVHMTIYLRSPATRAALSEEWLKAFPDAHSRPARHTLVYDHLPEPMQVQCSATAYVED
ncbi:MAG: RidA family protein [Sphingomonas sp.]|uniref:RidA family protein n=1 Tax=Sphingomonas sp. TaxID=28214 RepID=UPI001AD4047C|nr:RidA family protein [Sphingomonas sp.]MBN8816502.1 RidA family protein [Sphingomonas sp.]